MAIALRDGFEFEGYSVTMAKDGATGFRLATEKDLDVIILDVMLPQMSGLDVCKKLRNAGNNIPIILLTARGQEIDKVLGLKTGADDYVTKPFSFMELMARVEALLRRTGSGASRATSCRFGDVEVDFQKCEARKNGKPFELSARELRLLEYFVDHRGEVLAREQLLGAVWGYGSDSFSRTVDV